MASEKDLEDVLAKYPEVIEGGLRVVGRQTVVCGRRIDLLFEDRFRRNLLVELKWRPIKDQDIGQLMAYTGALLSGDRPDLRVMLIGTRVPPNLQRALDFHGIAWKEITVADVLALLKEKQDRDFASVFEGELALAPTPAVRGTQAAKRCPADVSTTMVCNPGAIDAAAEFFRIRLAAGHRTNGAGGLIYPASGRMRWKVYRAPKHGRARVLQKGRFDGDEEYWRSHLPSKSVGTARHGDDLRFFLVERSDFECFQNVMENEAPGFAWLPRR